MSLVVGIGSLLGSGHALSLHVSLAVAAGGYLVARWPWPGSPSAAGANPAERVAPSGPDARRLTLGGRGDRVGSHAPAGD
jgi:hypothetical protein